MSRLEYLLAGAAPPRRQAVLLPSPRCGATGSCWRPPGSRRWTATCSTSIERCSPQHPELDYVRPRSSRTATAWRASWPTWSGSCAACTTCRPRACSSSTTRTCRSTSLRIGPATTVVQVWHAAGALKRFGLDTAHAAGRAGADVPASLLRLRSSSAANGRARPVRRGPPDAGRAGPPARLATHGLLLRRRGAGRRARPGAGRVTRRSPAAASSLYAPTFRGRGHRQAGGAPGSTRSPSGRRCRPTTSLVLKTHPNLDPATTATAGFDVVVDPATEINDLLAATDILITDYSSSVVEFALLRRPIVLLVRRPGRVRARSRAVPRLPDRDDRHPGRRHGRGRSTRSRPSGSTCRATTPSSSASSGTARAAPASASCATSSSDGPGVARRGDTLPPDVRHV